MPQENQDNLTFPKYGSIFVKDCPGPNCQTGIIPPPLASMGFIVIVLKEDHNRDNVCNALVSVEDIQIPPYIPQNQVKFPVPKPEPTKLVESIYTYCTRTANLLPSNRMYFSIGFGYELWKKWDMPKPANFVPFQNWENKLDPSRKPFQDVPKNSPLRKYYDGKKYSIPRTDGDIIIQLKTSNMHLIDAAAAHVILLLTNESKKITVNKGFVKQRNEFGFFDASSLGQFTQNPVIEVGPVTRAWIQECPFSNKMRKDHGDQYIDLGRYSTTFIGNEEPNPMLRQGCFGMLSTFIHDLEYGFDQLTIKQQENIFGRQKESGGFIKIATDNPLIGTLNKELPRCHIVRMHIRGRQPSPNDKPENKNRWLIDDFHQNNQIDKDGKYNVEASAVPFQIYRQACSFNDNENGVQGLHFFTYTRDCNIVESMFERLIGNTTAVSDLPDGDKIDPNLSRDPTNAQYHVDELLYYNQSLGGQYYYFPNLQQLFSLSNWPNTLSVTPIFKDINAPFLDVLNLVGDKCQFNIQWDSVSSLFIHKLLQKNLVDFNTVETTDSKEQILDEENNDTSSGPAYMQSDYIKKVMEAIVNTNVSVVWKKINKTQPKSMRGVKVAIIGAGMAGLSCAYELKKIGVDVQLIEVQDTVGGRVKTLRFGTGLHAEAGAMRLPGSPDPSLRTVSHWLTDYYIKAFDLEVASFKNTDANSLIQILSSSARNIDWSKIEPEFEKKHYQGWDETIKQALSNDKLPPSQRKILESITSISAYFEATTQVVINELINAIKNVKIDETDGIDEVDKSYSYSKKIREIWGSWVARWSIYDMISFLSTSATNVENKNGIFDGLRPWPHIAIRGVTQVIYAPNMSQTSLVELLRDTLGRWWEDPMHTLRNGMDVLPRAFVEGELRGGQSTATINLKDNICYGYQVYKIDYSKSTVQIYAMNTHSKKIRIFESEYCIITTPLPVIENIEINPPLSNKKQEAIRMTRYENSTKIALQFREKFWAVDVEKENRPRLPKDQIIEGGSSITVSTASQIVYPTPPDYQFPGQNSPYIDWYHSDDKHLDDNNKRGILVSYTWQYQAERLAALSVEEACRICLNDVASLHALARYPQDEEKRKRYEETIEELFETGKMMAWSRNPYTAGAFTLFAPFNYLDYWMDLIVWPEGKFKFSDCKSIQQVEELLLKLRSNGSKSQRKLIQTILKEHPSFITARSSEIDKKFDKQVLLECVNIASRLQKYELYLAGEAISWCNGWIQGALESSLRCVYQLFENHQRCYIDENNDNAIPNWLARSYI